METLREILNQLQEQDFILLVNEEIKKRKEERYFYEQTKSEIYNIVDSLIIKLIKSMVDDKRILVKEDFHVRDNQKDRSINIYMEKENEALKKIISIYYTVTTKKENQKDFNLKSIKIDFDYYKAFGNEKYLDMTFLEIYTEQKDKEKQKKEDNLKIKLPLYINECESLFKVVLEKMQKGEELSSDEVYDLENIGKKYDKLRGVK
nr:MAG TPA: hypothetical protein [Caudoviricetes sp.]